MVLVADTPGTLFDATDLHREYLERPVEAICKDCKRSHTSTQRALEANGWELSWRGTICPNCSAIDRQFIEVFV